MTDTGFCVCPNSEEKLLLDSLYGGRSSDGTVLLALLGQSNNSNLTFLHIQLFNSLYFLFFLLVGLSVFYLHYDATGLKEPPFSWNAFCGMICTMCTSLNQLLLPGHNILTGCAAALCPHRQTWMENRKLHLPKAVKLWFTPCL